MAVTPAPVPGTAAVPVPPSAPLTLIVNPTATTVTARRAEQIAQVLEGRFTVDVQHTDGPGHATGLAADAVRRGTEVVAVYAGDGTTNEAIRALAGSGTALAHLPGGNSSVLARMLGLGADGVAAARRIAGPDARVRRIDLGSVDGRPFAFTAGIGLDAAVVRLVDGDLARKHRFRWGAFWMEAVRLARAEYFIDEPTLTIQSGGESRAGVTAIVQNGPVFSYVGPRHLVVGQGATLASGTLAATALLPGLGWRDVPTITARVVATHTPAKHPRIAPLPASPEVLVQARVPLPLQLDGDYWKDVTEARFGVLPGALHVLA